MLQPVYTRLPHAMARSMVSAMDAMVWRSDTMRTMDTMPWR